ncbi:hypothetical protein [Geothrix sp. PMB-07]|uniref:hypothetical protein n=1 Tax=Geothrix sp. PMB-07 TaxID=3068640 RepID=UPI00274083DA|nr:hypothetical protein [Geothrix sp. PMB-07]WLT30453.1 hypothetical protein Q9293_12070 [Geothrix sp. PMB-07]
MPYAFTDLGSHYLIVLSGVFTDRDVRDLALTVKAAEEAAPVTLDRLVDGTQIESFKIGFSILSIFAERRKAFPVKNPIKTALLVRGKVAFGLARMFQMLNNAPGVDIRIVASREEALTWFEGGVPSHTGDPTLFR